MIDSNYLTQITEQINEVQNDTFIADMDICLIVA